MNLSVPPQRAYPISFLAEVQETDYTEQPLVVEAVFSQASAGAPWLISYLVSYVGAPPLLHSSSDAPVPATPQDISAVDGQLASFFQTVFNTGSPPANSWPQSGSIKQETDTVIADRKALAQNKFQEALTYSPGTHSPPFNAPGLEVMCGEIRSHSVTTTTSGSPIVQPADQSTFGQELPAGSYASVTNDGIRDACWDVNPSGAVAPITFFGGVYSRVGAPV